MITYIVDIPSRSVSRFGTSPGDSEDRLDIQLNPDSNNHPNKLGITVRMEDQDVKGLRSKGIWMPGAHPMVSYMYSAVISTESLGFVYVYIQE